MAYWTIKTEIDDGENNLIVFITNDKQEFETMFDAPEEYINALKKGVYLTDDEVGTINTLSKIYTVPNAIDVVTAFRFKSDDVIDAKFMLAPNTKEARQYFEFVDSTDIKELLLSVNISGRQFAKKIHLSERTLRDKFNDSKPKSQLTLSEKYLALVLFNQSNG